MVDGRQMRNGGRLTADTPVVSFPRSASTERNPLREGTQLTPNPADGAFDDISGLLVHSRFRHII